MDICSVEQFKQTDLTPEPVRTVGRSQAKVKGQTVEQSEEPPRALFSLLNKERSDLCKVELFQGQSEASPLRACGSLRVSLKHLKAPRRSRQGESEPAGT